MGFRGYYRLLVTWSDFEDLVMCSYFHRHRCTKDFGFWVEVSEVGPARLPPRPLSARHLLIPISRPVFEQFSVFWLCLSRKGIVDVVGFLVVWDGDL